MKTEDGIRDHDTEVLQEMCYKAFYRSWAAYTKYLRSLVLDKDKVVVCSVVGCFGLVKNLSEQIALKSEKTVCYAASPELLQQYGFKTDYSHAYNLQSANFKDIKYRHVFNNDKLHTVNYGAIAQAADITETTLMYILRQILMAIETAVRKDYYVKLNLRIGFLKFKQSGFYFEN